MNENLTSIQIAKTLRAELNMEKALRERETLRDVNYTEIISELLACWREHRPDPARPVEADAGQPTMTLA